MGLIALTLLWCLARLCRHAWSTFPFLELPFRHYVTRDVSSIVLDWSLKRVTASQLASSPSQQYAMPEPLHRGHGMVLWPFSHIWLSACTCTIPWWHSEQIIFTLPLDEFQHFEHRIHIVQFRVFVQPFHAHWERNQQDGHYEDWNLLKSKNS